MANARSALSPLHHPRLTANKVGMTLFERKGQNVHIPWEPPHTKKKRERGVNGKQLSIVPNETQRREMSAQKHHSAQVYQYKMIDQENH